MSDEERTRPIHSVLDVLRARINSDDFDAAVFALEAVVADLGYGDVRPIPGSIAWIDKLRAEGTKIGLVFGGENTEMALDLAGIGDRFGAFGNHQPIDAVLEALGVAPERALAVDITPEGLRAARDSGIPTTIGLARGAASPESLRRAGATAVVADLQELL